MFLTYVVACASPVATYTRKDIAFYQLDQENVKHDIVVAILMSSMAWVKRCYSEKSKKSQ